MHTPQLNKKAEEIHLPPRLFSLLVYILYTNLAVVINTTPILFVFKYHKVILSIPDKR
jgi:hypothetical protein